MSEPRRLKPEIQKLLHSIASDNLETAASGVSDLSRQKMLALRESFVRMQRTRVDAFKPGDLVRYQPRMKYTEFPAYGEVMVVVEVLDKPVLTHSQFPGSPYFRTPENLVLGTVKDGNFHCWHFDGRRFEKASAD